MGIKTKLNSRLVILQRADLSEANISANKISFPQGQSYTGKEYYDGSQNLNLNLHLNLHFEFEFKFKITLESGYRCCALSSPQNHN